MTTVERLAIRGIRSYSPDDETVVRFHKPLTIFCGHNGSGKSKFHTIQLVPHQKKKGLFPLGTVSIVTN